ILAGFVIAFSQPIRIDDVVIVEGEWGHIEEINTTNVIVKVWDQRRIVLPITYFVEKPFQNWTKTSADIWGTTDFYVDYNMPVEEMRTELGKILKSTKLWDGKINSLQVTDLNEKTMKVRALMSAKDSSEAWDLRCYVREKMINFMQEKYPDKLPKIRAEIKNK
ncbi:MAG: mechanosensitive ion channel family protein, partial [Nanoarchaeota archaeon]|nr:mechanosensitive ion channel family protein [Nanoarchaeota archaeon]